VNAAVPSTPVGTETFLELPTGSTVAGYLSRPDGSGPWPGVVVLHEAWGLNDDIRRICDDVGAMGYLAVAPDLLARGRLRCLAEAFRTLSRGHGPTLDTLTAVVDWLAAQPDCADGRVGAIGFCIGGGLAWLLGCTGTVRAVAPNYGASQPLERLMKSCPVVASYGERDVLFRRESAKARERLQAAGVAHDIESYRDAGHSFMNRTDGHAMTKRMLRPIMHLEYDDAAASDTWRRIREFFDRHL
jgi:carboxymethylenebutenolidase